MAKRVVFLKITFDESMPGVDPSAAEMRQQLEDDLWVGGFSATKVEVAERGMTTMAVADLVRGEFE